MGKANPTLWITLIFAALLVGGVLYMGTRGAPQTATDTATDSGVDQPNGGAAMQSAPAPVPATGTVQPAPETTDESAQATDPLEITQGQGPEVRNVAPPAEPAETEVTPSTSTPPLTLVQAADAGDVERLRQLLAAGADANAPTTADGMTPLMRAAKGGHLEAVFLLLDFGADPSKKDTLDKTASNHAVGHPQIIAVLDGASAPPAEPDPTK
jgi:hypothetical protein